MHCQCRRACMTGFNMWKSAQVKQKFQKGQMLDTCIWHAHESAHDLARVGGATLQQTCSSMTHRSYRCACICRSKRVQWSATCCIRGQQTCSVIFCLDSSIQSADQASRLWQQSMSHLQPTLLCWLALPSRHRPAWLLPLQRCTVQG